MTTARGRRSVVLAFATLATMMAAHATLESARDALLLRALSPQALLWSYVVIAALTLLTARRTRALPPLPVLLLGGAAASTAFWVFMPAILPAGALLFYVFTALYASVVVPRFWLQLAETFSVGEAKRVYPWIGVGGLLGATVGSGLAASLLLELRPRFLLLLGAGLYAIAAVIARITPGEVAARPSLVVTPLRSAKEPRQYLRLLVIAAVLASATFTVVDYLFKSTVAATVPKAELASSFARAYTVMNLMALVFQVVVAPFILRRAGTHVAAMLLPVLLLATTGGFAFLGAPAFAVLAKTADGSLRNSLHRVTSELFYFPIPDRTRARWKSVADAIGQRGGQAAGALAVLAIVAIGGGPRVIGGFALVLALGWSVFTLALREPYVDLFKDSLRRGAVPTTVPVLASDTLQTLLEAFSSRDDDVVCAAIDLLADTGNTRLLPSVLVHHPSPVVALRALDALVQADRSDLPVVVAGLAAHPDAAVRAAALRARMRNEPDVDDLARGLDDPDVDVRATALVALAQQPARAAEAVAKMNALLREGDDGARLALARALPARPFPGLTTVLTTMLAMPALPLRRQVLRAMARNADPAYLPILLPLLGDRRILAEARTAVVAATRGDETIVEGWLADTALPRPVRRHIPRTLSAFGTDRAASALVAQLAREEDDAVAFKILRGLGRMRANRPSIPVDGPLLLRLATKEIDRAAELLAFRVALDGAKTELLAILLGDLEQRSLERAFRLVGIVRPQQGLEDVWRGFQSSSASARDAALEVVDALPLPVRSRLHALLQSKPPRERLRDARASMLDEREAFAAMLRDRSLAVRELARESTDG